jgi:hypothetical protein
MVFTVRLEADVTKKDDFVVTSNFLETALEQSAGLFVVAGKPFLIGAGHPFRRVEEALPCGIVTSPGNQRANGAP